MSWCLPSWVERKKRRRSRTAAKIPNSMMVDEAVSRTSRHSGSRRANMALASGRKNSSSDSGKQWSDVGNDLMGGWTWKGNDETWIRSFSRTLVFVL